MLDVAWYEALLYWKLYSQPAAVSNIGGWLGNDQSRIRNHKELQRLLTELPPTISREVSTVTSLVSSLSKYALDGMKSNTALPVRTTFLHMLYPDVIPIFDKMVLQAVGIRDKNANQNKAVLGEYLPHAWAMADQHARQLVGFREEPIRLVDMALWVMRGTG